jgi:hypothetical protein
VTYIWLHILVQGSELFLIGIEAKLVSLLHLLTCSHGMECGPGEQGLNQS